MQPPERFLIIDDDPGNNLLCELVIERAIKGTAVISFTSPRKGFEYIKSEYQTNPVNTILFLDINMPTLSGWDVLTLFEDIKELIEPNFTIYMLSSSVNPADKELAAKNHFVAGYLVKPLTKTIVTHLLAEVKHKTNKLSTRAF
jgi:CheY-like chemotaxis protein